MDMAIVPVAGVFTAHPYISYKKQWYSDNTDYRLK